MSVTRFRASLAALAFGTCAASQAAIVVSNPPDQVYGTNMSFALVADNFTLGGIYDISSIKFWSIQSTAADYSGNLYWAIYSDAPGSPGAVLQSATTAVAALATGNSTGFGYGEYVFDIAVNFQLAAGDYWLALQNDALGSTTSTEMLWETSSAGIAPAGQYRDFLINPSDWVDTGNEHAFQLNGQLVGDPPPPPGGVPEPSTLALVFASLAAAVALRRQST